MTSFDNYYNDLNENTKRYFQTLYPKIPIEIKEYVDIIIRLKDIDYFCGMKYASPYLYNFKYDFSRLDHSINCFLWSLSLTNDFEQSLSALYHDCNTPIFSHVIDYLYKDYINQEMTESKNDIFLMYNNRLQKLLDKDDISIDSVINPKQYHLIDNDRPKLCVDRIDGILLTSLSWTQQLDFQNFERIHKSICILTNEEQQKEIGFDNQDTASEVNLLEQKINKMCHSDEDNFEMSLMSEIIKYSIKKKYIDESELNTLTEKEYIEIIKNKMNNDLKLQFLWDAFTKTTKIEDVKKEKIKIRYINPLYYDGNVKRLKSSSI